jgi:hypothetical protein
MRSWRESMAGETSSRPTIAGFEISTRATPGISASLCINRRYLYSVYITTCFGPCFGHHQVISIQSRSTFLCFPASIGQCLHLRVGHVCCLQCRLPLTDLDTYKYQNIYKTSKPSFRFFEGHTLFTVPKPFKFHLQTLKSFNLKYG